MIANAPKSNYYLQRKNKYWKQLERLFRSSTKILPRYLEADTVQIIHKETKEEFEDLLSKLPYIGGNENILTFTFVSSAAALAYMRVLEKYGLSVKKIGKLINEIYEDVFISLPKIIKWYMRWSEFSPRNQRKLKVFAKDSQLRKYPGNWVIEYIDGKGDDFDFGCNYTECAVLKFYKQMEAERFMPYVCVMDFTMSKALRTGLYRSKSLYFGAGCCDFRYKKNQLGLPSLPIEDLPEYKNREY